MGVVMVMGVWVVLVLEVGNLESGIDEWLGREVWGEGEMCK